MAAAICACGEKRTTNIREREAENNQASKLKEITHLVFLPEVNEFCICKHGQMQIEDCQLLHTCTWFIYYLSRGIYLEGVTSVCKSHAIPSEELTISDKNYKWSNLKMYRYWKACNCLIPSQMYEKLPIFFRNWIIQQSQKTCGINVWKIKNATVRFPMQVLVSDLIGAIRSFFWFVELKIFQEQFKNYWRLDSLTNPALNFAIVCYGVSYAPLVVRRSETEIRFF